MMHDCATNILMRANPKNRNISYINMKLDKTNNDSFDLHDWNGNI